ncbi:MAG TPA: Rne/Rng family ribonuclease, partial [Gammaproteobacteria bacterium]|nr:Rne/Rng family ribonuclease [Gammaproteobacteria bacterium]
NEPGTYTSRGGYIARTAAEGATKETLLDDMHFLQQLWQSISVGINGEEVPSLVFEDLPLVLRSIRDISSINVEKICIDSKETYTKATVFAQQFTPELVPRIEHYIGDHPILDLYSTEEEIERALQPKVQLESGGYLVIEQTEAMTTIDVNTGGFVGYRNLEETILKTNLEATQTIARQLRLRNLGGIIIIDFIDMSNEEHQCQVLQTLENWLARDYSRTMISEISSLGLVQITRKRTRESLEHVLCEQCPTCSGRGAIKSARSVCYEILRDILREARQHDAKHLKVIASQCVVDILLKEESSSIFELEEFIRIPIRLEVEATYRREQYDVVLL